MANRTHVPKFGDWNNQDQPFTVVFNNARTNKRADLYESLENSEIKPQARAPPQSAPRNPKPVKDDTPRAPPPRERNKVRAPPADELCGGGGRSRGRGEGGGGSRNQRQPQGHRPMQHIPNVRGGSSSNSNGKGGVTIPPFPGSVSSSDQNMTNYTQIFEQVKEERREGFRSSGESAGNTPTPSRPINGRHNQSPSPNSSYSSSKVCCFAWCRKGSKY